MISSISCSLVICIWGVGFLVCFGLGSFVELLLICLVSSSSSSYRLSPSHRMATLSILSVSFSTEAFCGFSPLVFDFSSFLLLLALISTIRFSYCRASSFGNP